jgi:plastocyanin
MQIRRLALAPLVLTGVLSLAACGSDDDNKGADQAASTTAGDSAGGVVVTGLDGIRWDEDSYTAAAGNVEITLRNESSLPHTLQLLAEDGTEIGRELEATGQNDEDVETIELAAGTYTILCTVPGHGAMKATLTVS